MAQNLAPFQNDVDLLHISENRLILLVGRPLKAKVAKSDPSCDLGIAQAVVGSISGHLDHCIHVKGASAGVFRSSSLV